MAKHLRFGEIEDYRTRKTRQRDNKELRKEYSRLRSIARKRLERIKGTEFESSQVYQQNAGHYPQLREIKSEAMLRERLSDLAKFIEAKTSTLTGLREQRKSAIATLHENDFTFINEDNYDAFGRFMEAWRDQKLDEEYDSESAVELFESVDARGIPPETVYDKMEEWLEANDEFSRARRYPVKVPTTSKELRKRLGMIE